MSVDKGGGGKDKKVSVNGPLQNNPGEKIEREGMETLSMVVSTVGRTYSRVVSFLGS